MDWYKVYPRDRIHGWHRKYFDGRQCAVWYHLHDLAAEAARRGYIEMREGVPYELDELVSQLGEYGSDAEECVGFVLSIAQSRGFLAKDGNGCLYLTSWGESQAVPEGKSWREKQERKAAADEARFKEMEAKREAAEQEYKAYMVESYGVTARRPSGDGKSSSKQPASLMPEDFAD